MAAYPSSTTIVPHKGSQVVARNNIFMDVAEDGTVRGRKLHVKETYDVVIVHDMISAADANTIEDFYEANPTQQVDVVWRTVTYNCYWVSKPVVDHYSADLWVVTSRLIGVRSDGA